MRWYITVAAVTEYQRIAGLPVTREGDEFGAARMALSALCEQARLVRDEGHRAIYRLTADVGGRRRRLELTVSLAFRDEGDLPQLVRVRDKGPVTRR